MSVLKKFEIGVVVTLVLAVIGAAFWLGDLSRQVASFDPDAIAQAQREAIETIEARAKEAVEDEVGKLSADVSALQGTKTNFDATMLAGKRIEVGTKERAFDKDQKWVEFRVDFNTSFSSLPVVVGSVAQLGASNSMAGQAHVSGGGLKNAYFEVRDIASDPSGFWVRIERIPFKEGGFNGRINCILSYVAVGDSSP